MKILRLTSIFRATVVSTMFFAATVGAQTGWLHPEFNRGIMLEVSKSNLKYVGDLSFGSMVWTLTGDFPVARGMALVTEFSVVHVGYKNTYNSYQWWNPPVAQTAVGNPYFGLDFQSPGSSIFGRVGFRVPLASEDNDDALSFGALSQFGRFEAFAPKVSTISVQLGYRHKSRSEPLIVRCYIQPDLMLPKEGDAEMFGSASAEFGFQAAHFGGTMGIQGRAIITESDIDFAERTMFLLGAAANVNVTRTRIGAFVHVPLDNDWQELIDVTYGISLMYHFK